jgi:hypothetical protein
VEVENGVVEKRLSARFRVAAESGDETGQHAGFAESAGRGAGQATRWDVVDCMSELVERPRGFGVAGIEASEQVRELGEANRRVIGDARRQQLLDLGRSPALRHVDIHAGVEHKLETRVDGSGYECKLRVAAARQKRRMTLRLDSPKGCRAVKTQDRGRAKRCP